MYQQVYDYVPINGYVANDDDFLNMSQNNQPAYLGSTGTPKAAVPEKKPDTSTPPKPDETAWDRIKVIATKIYTFIKDLILWIYTTIANSFKKD